MGEHRLVRAHRADPNGLRRDGRSALDGAPKLDPGEIPDLDLRAGAVSVDIGYLADKEHRAAFAMIFVRLIEANQPLLGGLALTAIRARRPIPTPPRCLRELPAPWADVAAETEAVALALYDSLNEEISLELSGTSEANRLSIRFDNPQFRFD